MLPLEPWWNSTPFFGAAAFCTTKIGDFRTSSTLSFLRRPLRKYQLRGTATAFCTTKIVDFRALSTLSTLPTWLRRPLRKDQLFENLARRRGTSHNIARLLLMVSLEPWRNSTPFFGAAAFCTTKIGDFRTSSTLSSLMTWLKRPLRKYQFRGTATALCTTKIDDFRAYSTLSSLTTWLRRPLRKDQLGGTFKMHCTSLSTSALFRSASSSITRVGKI